MNGNKSVHNCRVGSARTSAVGRAENNSVMGKIKDRYYDWDGFFKAIKKLKIKNEKDYKNRYKQDPLLPEDPSVIVDFPGWETILKLLYKQPANP